MSKLQKGRPRLNFQTIRHEIWFLAVRSRGPGGQNVNKTSSAAQLFWPYQWSAGLSPDEKARIAVKLKNMINKEGEVYLRSDESRDLERNKQLCFEKLEQLLKAALFKPKARRATKPTRSSKLKRLDSKTRHGELKKSRQKIRD
ncbi:MAG: alternative ribosome rescue aminoacyl-tRNA hydrolase ArfB [Bdellovibrionales bacterium]